MFFGTFSAMNFRAVDGVPSLRGTAQRGGWLFKGVGGITTTPHNAGQKMSCWEVRPCASADGELKSGFLDTRPAQRPLNHRGAREWGMAQVRSGRVQNRRRKLDDIFQCSGA